MSIQSLYSYVPSLPITLPEGFPQSPYTDTGYSANGIRLLLNRLVGSIPANSERPYAYLEIGLFTGSTFFPAIWNSPHVLSIGIDCWVGTKHPKEIMTPDQQRQEFFSNLNYYKESNPDHNPDNIQIIDGDAFSQQTLNQLADLKQLSIDGKQLAEGRIKVFFYDGCHTAAAQRDALLTYYPYLADDFIYLTDDWYNIPNVSKGTHAAFDMLCDPSDPYYDSLINKHLPTCNCVESMIIPKTKPFTMPLGDSWHCGIGVFHCKKVYSDVPCTNKISGIQYSQ